ncbi:MAG: DinB family protein, partial [Nitrososphaerota archaeon]|nr:DinB family protein [Nitrososphaerota archaeon]
MTALSESKSKSIVNLFNETRSRTLELVKTLEKDDFVVQTEYYTSPPKWHLGHVSWIYEVVLSKLNTDYEFYSKEFSEYLNSYYRQFGEPRDKGKRGIMSRPTVEQVLEYFQTVNQLVTDFLKKNLISNKANQLLTIGMHHECQHQELLVYDLQHLLADEYRPVKKNSPPTPSKVTPESVAIGGGLYTMGYNGDNFCYDIELPEHKIFLNNYRIDAFPITNEQY